jgi:hypothetical protein
MASLNPLVHIAPRVQEGTSSGETIGTVNLEDIFKNAIRTFHSSLASEDRSTFQEYNAHD